MGGQWNETIVYDAGAPGQQRTYQQTLQLELNPGQSVVQRIGAEGADLTGRVQLPQNLEWDFDRSYVSVVQRKELPPAADGKLRLSGTQRVLRSVHQLKLSPDGSFRIYNLLPVEQELTVSLSPVGDKGRGAYSKVIPITLEMFEGKSTRAPIDLGDIQVDAPK